MTGPKLAIRRNHIYDEEISAYKMQTHKGQAQHRALKIMMTVVKLYDRCKI